LNPKFLLYGGLTILVPITIWGALRWGFPIALGIPLVAAMLWFGLTILLRLWGDVNAEQGNYTGALQRYSQAEALYCRQAQLYCNRGKIFYRTGELAKAATDFSRSLELNPRQGEAYLGRGAILMATGQNDAALSDYDRAIEAQPNLAEAHHSRGIIQLRLGNLRAAQDNFQRSIELKSDFFHPHYYLGLVQAALAELTTAQATIAQAIDLRPQYPPLYYVQGKLIVDQHSDLAGATPSFTVGQEWEKQTGVDRYANDEYGYFYRGWALHYAADHESAHQDWLTAQNLANHHHNQQLLPQIELLLKPHNPEAV
jgi:tetratricopeptide (TPR) repeat protein